MTVLLALDSATEACSVAVWDDGTGGTVRAHHFERRARGHAETLIPLVRTVMAEAGLGFAALDAIATTVGPGTFTGLRIGLAAARGLALAADRPLIGVTTLEAVAHQARAATATPHPILALLDARRGEVYAQLFGADCAPTNEPRALTPAAAAGLAVAGPVLLAGAGAPLVAPHLADGIAEGPPPGHGLPDAAVIAEIATARPGQAPHEVAPLYLRAPDARLPGS